MKLSQYILYLLTNENKNNACAQTGVQEGVGTYTSLECKILDGTNLNSKNLERKMFDGTNLELKMSIICYCKHLNNTFLDGTKFDHINLNHKILHVTNLDFLYFYVYILCQN